MVLVDAADPGFAQARLQLALEASQMGLWDWDLSTGLLVWDERSAEMYGTTLAESTGSIEDVNARVHPEDLDHVHAVLSGAVERAGAVDVEFRVIWPDGSVHWLYGRGQALTDETGTVVRLIGANLDVTDARQAAHERSADALRMAGLVNVAQALADAQSEEEILAVVTGLGASALGAQGAVLTLVDPGEQTLRALTTSFFDDALRADVARIPADTALPMVAAATQGVSLFLEDRETALVLFPSAREIYERARTEAAAAVPLTRNGELVGSLSVAFDAPHQWRLADRELLEVFASLTGQALERVHARAAEAAMVVASRQLSETLQRALLTAPPHPVGMTIAARYLPATEEAQVGGDWHDSFQLPDGRTALSIGDIAGHDGQAAAAMSQVRNILRGIAQALDATPSETLVALEKALQNLHVDTLATGLLCHVGPDASGACTLRWSNAGHPPPLLLAADGNVEVLERDPDLLLGLVPDSERHDHEVPLSSGSTLILYTDGLVERRGESLDAGIAALAAAVTRLHGLDVEQLGDALLAQWGPRFDDDVAMLAIRVD